MTANRKKKTAIWITMILLIGVALAWGVYSVGSTEDTAADDAIEYEGNMYEPVAFNADIFYYCYNGDEYFEEDIKYPITGADWKMVYDSGDLFCISDRADEANAYYTDDDNYDWFVTISEKDSEKEMTYPIEVSGEELSYIYGMEDMDREKPLFFDEIEAFATLKKVSRDGMVQGRTELAYSRGDWYWRSEIIDESKERDGTWPEYVQKLPDSLYRTWKVCY